MKNLKTKRAMLTMTRTKLSKLRIVLLPLFKAKEILNPEPFLVKPFYVQLFIFNYR